MDVLRSLLLALDGSFWDDAASHYTVALVRRHDADVLALSLAPSDDQERPMYVASRLVEFDGSTSLTHRT
jgi:hypothetical protein